MEEQELSPLFSDLESDRVERKSSASDRDKLREAICAFANDLPNHRKQGVIFIGVKDDGTCAQLKITDELLRKIADIKTEGLILPVPSLSVCKISINGCELIAVIVTPSDSPPVRFKGRVYIRIGPRRGIATADEERQLTERRRGRTLPFDLSPIDVATLDDLDMEMFKRNYLPTAVSSDILAQNQRSTEEQLRSTRFATIDSFSKPTVTGMLVIGKDVRRFLPCAYIQFLRIDGMRLTDPIKDQKELDGPLPELLRMVDETFQAHISTSSEFSTGTLEVKKPDYPIVALQQLARNAVMHRVYEGTNAPVRINWFNDRIEIQNPGGPYGQVSRENFGRLGITDYRNPHVAEAMKNLGYIQRFGVGIELARNELAKNGNPPPEFIIESTHIQVCIRKHR